MRTARASFVVLAAFLGYNFTFPENVLAGNQLPSSTVPQACLGPQTDMVLRLRNYDFGYLSYNVQNANTAGGMVLKHNIAGTFVVIMRADARVDVAAMVAFGVFSKITNALCSGSHAW